MWNCLEFGFKYLFKVKGNNNNWCDYKNNLCRLYIKHFKIKFKAPTSDPVCCNK